MRKLLLFFIALIASLSYPNTIEAHVLENTATVGAVLHVSPNDDPITGTQTELLFEVHDTSKIFDPLKCNCTVMIQKGEKIISATELVGYNSTDDSSTLKFIVVFPETDVYFVSLIATPYDKRDFTPFKLDYDIRVARQEASPDPQEIEIKNTVLKAVAVFAVLLGVLLAFIAVKKYRLKDNNKK